MEAVYEVQSDVLEISKALGEDTRFAIFREIASADGPLTVKDLVADFGMHHSAIRIHLNKLEEAGLIVSQKRHTPGAVGRPQLAFLPSPNTTSISLPTRNYRLLSDLTVELIAAKGMNPDSAEEFGYEWGARRVRERGHGSNGSLPFDEGVDILVSELNDMGGAFTKTASNGGGCIIGQKNCPFLEVAQKHEAHVCSLFQGVARGMLAQLVGHEVVWNHRASLLEGDSLCEAELALAPTTV